MVRRLYAFVLFVLCGAGCMAQTDDWEPTGVWPFVNRRFQTATVYAGMINVSKTVVPCNIHIGNQTLWYSQNDVMMEAIPGTIRRVEFKNAVYVPVGQQLGRVVRDDTVGGKLARLICVKRVDQVKLDERSKNALNMTQNLLQSSFGGLMGLGSSLADANGGVKEEELPIPLKTEFYIVYNNEVFIATEKNILNHINPLRKKEYRNFTRAEEIISSNESSMLKVWNEFFLKW